jgi:general secretion pathway protein J
LRAVQGFLRTQLSAALPIAFEFNSDTGEATFLRTSQTKLEFVATMPGYLSRGGPYLQTLELVRGENGQRLIFNHQLLTTDGALDAEREPVVLLDGIADGAFEVRTLDPQSRPGQWQSTWNTSAQLPPLVRLRIRFTDASRRWPDLVVAPRLGAAFGEAASLQLATGQ